MNVLGARFGQAFAQNVRYFAESDSRSHRSQVSVDSTFIITPHALSFIITCRECNQRRQNQQPHDDYFALSGSTYRTTQTAEERPRPMV